MYLPEGDLRDLWGFRSFDRQLYIYHFKRDLMVARSVPGTGEVERTGEITREEGMWSVIAPDRELADFAFNRQHSDSERHNFNAEIINVEVVPISAAIGGISHG